MLCTGLFSLLRMFKLRCIKTLWFTYLAVVHTNFPLLTVKTKSFLNNYHSILNVCYFMYSNYYYMYINC